MAKIMISLISEQTIPNLLLIKEMQDIERHVLVSTQRMEKNGKSQALIAALAMDPNKFGEPIIVQEDRLEDIEAKLSQLDFADDDHFIVNITGGTKIMSLGVYNFFRERNSEIYYVPIEKNIYWKIHPRVRQNEQPLTYRVTLAEYLTAYGITIKNPKTLAPKKPAEENRRFFEFYVGKHYTELAPLNQLRAYRGKKQFELDEKSDIYSFLRSSPFTPEDSTLKTLNKDEIEYLTGGWFEDYVYDRFREFLKLDESRIGRSLQISKANVDNELDIAFVYENRFYVIECKTSIAGPHADENLMDDTIYKLEALRREFGLAVHPYIFTLASRGENKMDVKPKHFQRTKLFQINIVDRDTLCDETKLKQVLQEIKARGTENPHS